MVVGGWWLVAVSAVVVVVPGVVVAVVAASAAVATTPAAAIVAAHCKNVVVSVFVGVVFALGVDLCAMFCPERASRRRTRIPMKR